MVNIEGIIKTFDEIYDATSVPHVFIRIPKTGTQSMNIAIGQRWDHYSAAFCKGHLGTKWDETFSFSIVRNPWARMYSFFKYHKQHSDQEQHRLYREYDFESWVMDGFPHHYNQPHQKILFPKNPHIQYDWVSENNQIIVDHIIKLEDLKAGCAVVSDKLKLPINMPHINRTSRKGAYIEQYTEQMISEVAKYCAIDIEKFQYNFGE